MTFPAAPTVGDQFTNGAGFIYEYTADGAWRRVKDGSPFPADAAGVLTNDGAGTLTWEVQTTPLTTVSINAPLNGDGTAGNPLGVDYATETDPGVVNIATQAEVHAMADASKMVTPATLGGLLLLLNLLNGLPADASGVLRNDGAGGLSWSSSTQFYTGPTSPVGAGLGDMWWNTVDEVLYTRINDGTSDLWLDISSWS